jgi:hypothetical protein
MRIARLVMIVVLAVLTVSCGSGSDPPPASSDTLSDASRTSRSIADLVEALDGVGCPANELQEVTPTEGFDIFRQASCPDSELQVYTFTSKKSQDEVVDGILGIEGEFAVVGTNWVAETRSRRLADAVQAKVGGIVRE